MNETAESNPGIPSLLRVLNDRLALSLLLEHGTLTKNELARLSGLSKPTAAEMVRRLEESQLISIVGEQSGRRGPAANTYGVRLDRELGVAIDVTPSLITSTVVDVLGTEHPIAQEHIDEHAERPAADVLKHAIDRACAAAGKNPALVTAVSVGIQAAVDPKTDDLLFNDDMPGWPRNRVRASLAEQLGVAVVINNDANLAAIAERTAGIGADASTFALLWLAEGLGLAVDLAGTIHQGSSGGAGEVGYLSAPVEATKYNPPATLIEDLVSDEALVALARHHGFTVSTYGEVVDLLATPEGGESRLAGLLDDLASRVCLALLPLTAVLDPELVVIAGPTGMAGGAALTTRMERWMRANSRWSPRIAVAQVTQTPVLRGARQVLIEIVRSALFDSVASIDRVPSSGEREEILADAG